MSGAAISCTLIFFTINMYRNINKCITERENLWYIEKLYYKRCKVEGLL